jgi:hypothetical protein
LHQAHHQEYGTVNLHLDSGKVLRVNKAVLLLYPVFCGLEDMEDLFLPGVSREDLLPVFSLPLSDFRFRKSVIVTFLHFHFTFQYLIFTINYNLPQ